MQVSACMIVLGVFLVVVGSLCFLPFIPYMLECNERIKRNAANMGLEMTYTWSKRAVPVGLLLLLAYWLAPQIELIPCHKDPVARAIAKPMPVIAHVCPCQK